MIAILIVATIHEFSHGIFARLRKIKIKSSGFAFLGPILAAFVEPDEKQLAKKSTKDQLFVFSAGPFSNIVLGVILLILLSFVFIPMGNGFTQVNGIIIGEVNQSLSINNSGLTSGLIMQEINGIKITDISIVTNVLEKQSPGDTVIVKANETNYNVILSKSPTNASRAILGISFSNYKVELKDKFKPVSWLYSLFSWFVMLLFWTFNISIGVGLFNLLPLGFVDGGRMFHVVMLKLTKNQKKALKLLSYVSIVILAMVLINLFPFILRLFKWIISPFI